MPDDLPTLPQDEPESELLPPLSSASLAAPRLSIMQLLVLTGLIAVCLAIERRTGEQPGALAPTDVTAIQQAVISACGVFGLVIYWQRRVHKIAFPTEPGEWILVVIGLNYVSRPLIEHIVSSHLNENERLAFAVSVTLRSLPAVLPIVLARALPLRIYFAIKIAIQLGFLILLGWMPYDAMQHFVYACFTVILELAILGWLVWQDSNTGQPRGWLHWLGIAAAAAPELIKLRAVVSYLLT